MAYDLPPPPPEEIVYIRRPVLVFDDPAFGFAPPPPAPVLFLAPPPPEFVVLEPPPPPVGIFLLPMPIYRPVPVWVSPPRYVAPPPNNVIYNNVHNTVVVNNVTNTVTVTNRSGQTTTMQPPVQASAPAPAGPGGACRGRPGRGDRTGAAAFSGAEGRHVANAKSARCRRRHRAGRLKGPTNLRVNRDSRCPDQCAAAASAERNPPIIRAIGGGDAGDNSAQQQRKAWDIVPAGARDRTGCARRPFGCRGTGNAGSREAGRNPRAADPTCSRGRKSGSTIASSGDKSLDSLGGHRARRRSWPATSPLVAGGEDGPESQPTETKHIKPSVPSKGGAQPRSQTPTAKLPPPSAPPKPSHLRPRRPPPVWPSLTAAAASAGGGPVGSVASAPASSKAGGPPAIRAARGNGQARSAAAITAGCQQGSRASPSAAVGTSAEAGRTCASGRCCKAGGCNSPAEGMPARKKCDGDKWSARLQIGHQDRGGHRSWRRNTG